MKKHLYYITYLICIVFFFTCALYLAHKSIPFYNFIKTPQRGWLGTTHKADSLLGYSAIPGAQGSHTFPIGDNLPMRYDQNGFRVPVDEDIDYTKKPLVLFLGCSFTYGDACLAKDTFAYLVSKHIDGSSINTGKCGYGLSQMLIIAKKLIPIYKPDYVVVQDSPWLADRSSKQYFASYYGTIPNPYFAFIDNKINLIKPVFETIFYDLPFSQYKTSDRGFLDFISFVINLSMPMYIHDEWNKLLVVLKMKLNLIPKPYENHNAIRKYVYSEINNLVQKNNGTMILLNIFYDIDRSTVDTSITKHLNNILTVDAGAALWNKLPTKTMENFEKEYKHWRGSPPNRQIVDGHPNPNAHAIIAHEISEVIKNNDHRK